MDLIIMHDKMPETLKIAEHLGVKKLVLMDCTAKQLLELQKNTKIKLAKCRYVNSSELTKAREGEVNVSGPQRGSVEHPRVLAIIDSELLERKDKLHQRNSGMNAVIAGIASEKNKVLLLNASLLSMEKRHQILGRFTQNIALAKKAGLPVLVVSGAMDRFHLRSPAELKALSEYLGIPLHLSNSAERLLWNASLSSSSIVRQ